MFWCFGFGFDLGFWLDYWFVRLNLCICDFGCFWCFVQVHICGFVALRLVFYFVFWLECCGVVRRVSGLFGFV